ncbi:zinc finger protein 595-like isoform X2 [Eurosta solidaginis]|uniref:zinc finger protein 595-like isoform X2 n=1 Tax=Eurosta solidaginis TaxID=178769 RepID=UPI003530AB0E
MGMFMQVLDADRLIFGESALTHALLFSVVSVDENGVVKLLRVANSWRGEKYAKKIHTHIDKNIRDKNEQYQYPCDICGQHFKRTWDLKIHKGIHSDEKPHKCDFCEKRFVRATALREHLRTHTGEKPYRCKYCERCFTTKRALNQHLRGNHLGDNTHRCEFCPLAFRLASELRLHSTTHKDEIPETHERNMTALREEAKLKVNR